MVVIVRGLRPNALVARFNPSNTQSPAISQIRLYNRRPAYVPKFTARGAKQELPEDVARDFTVNHIEGSLHKPVKCKSNRPAKPPGALHRTSPRIEQLPFLKISDEVREALANNRPVVALESTIYTHGFPYPENVALAVELEKTVRQRGAIPATIGIVDGIATIGLNSEQLIMLASAAGKPETMKVSRRDIPYILGMGIAERKLNGGTTVAATMYLAERSGIKVFGTGGLGGVHRGGQDTMDVSADLTELGRTSMAVVASGCKSFLDIPRTLEYLETQGATVVTFAQGRKGAIDFPAFYTVDSGVKSPHAVQNFAKAAAMIYAQELLGPAFRSGILFANPIPSEFAIPKADIDAAIDKAVQEAATKGIHGNANTPFILARIKELTKGNSIPANRALIKSNVGVAASLALELCALRRRYSSRVQHGPETPETLVPDPQAIQNEPAQQAKAEIEKLIDEENQEIQKGSVAPTDPDIMVFGSLAVDLSCDYSPRSESQDSETSKPETSTDISPHMHTSNISKIRPSIGGVGHNVALAAHRASGGLNVRLCSYVAHDLAGKTALAAIKEEGLDSTGVVVLGMDPKMPEIRTAQYVSINDAKKDLVLAMADMSIFDQRSYRSIDRDNASFQKNLQKDIGWSVIDANWSSSHIRSLLKWAKLSTVTEKRFKNAKVAFEPVSTHKSAGIFKPSKENIPLSTFPDHLIDLTTPNQHELAAMHASAKKYENFETDQWWQIIDSLGIPSSGARDRFVNITNAKMTDEGIPLQTIQLLPYIPTILTKLGSEGVLLTELLPPNDPRLTDPASALHILSRCTNGNTQVGGVYMRLFPAVEVVEDAVSVNGVGDTFLGVLVAGLARGLKLDERLIDISQRGAVMTLRSKEAVSLDVGMLAKELDSLVKDAEDADLLSAAGF